MSEGYSDSFSRRPMVYTGGGVKVIMVGGGRAALEGEDLWSRNWRAKDSCRAVAVR